MPELGRGGYQQVRNIHYRLNPRKTLSLKILYENVNKKNKNLSPTKWKLYVINYTKLFTLKNRLILFLQNNVFFTI